MSYLPHPEHYRSLPPCDEDGPYQVAEPTGQKHSFHSRQAAMSFAEDLSNDLPGRFSVGRRWVTNRRRFDQIASFEGGLQTKRVIR